MRCVCDAQILYAFFVTGVTVESVVRPMVSEKCNINIIHTYREKGEMTNRAYSWVQG